MVDRFDKFTAQARRVLTLANQEAQRLGQRHIGTDHLLLGLVAEGDGIAARVLANLGVRLPAVRAAIEAKVTGGAGATPREVGLTPRAKQAIERSVGEARRLNHHYIGTEHLLLGLLRVEDSTGATVLRELGVGHELARQQVMAVLSSSGGFPVSPAPEPVPVGPVDFERFNEGARSALALAQAEAQRFRHNYIGTEHLLLGLTRVPDGVAGRALSSLGAQLPKVRSAVEFIIGRGETMIMGEVGLTPRSQRALALAVDEARRLGHDYVGDEHLLLGLVREGEGIAAGVLASLGVRLDRVRALVEAELGGTGDGAPATLPPTPVMPTPPGWRLSPEEAHILTTPLGALLRVRPIIQRQEREGIAILAIALECYDNGFVITWRLEAAGARRGNPDFDFTTEDDWGNRYQALMYGGSGGGTPEHYDWRYAFRFAPALDPASRSLTLTFTPRRGGHALELGDEPWRFIVAIPPDAPLPDAATPSGP